jgi:Cu/Ag efflux pump CusA
MHQIQGLADIEVSREENYPEVNVVVDREKAALLWISETDVANAVLFSLNGNGQTDPIIYTDPQNGNEYYISAWLAEEHRKDLTDIENIILTARTGEPVLLKNVASLTPTASMISWTRVGSYPRLRNSATAALRMSRRCWSFFSSRKPIAAIILG